MTIVDKAKELVGLGDGSPSGRKSLSLRVQRKVELTSRSRDSTTDVRRKAPSCLPRQLRPPPNTAEPMPIRNILPTVEVRGTLYLRERRHTKRHANRRTAEQDERHSYEKCPYVEFKKRVAKMEELKAARPGERIGN